MLISAGRRPGISFSSKNAELIHTLIGGRFGRYDILELDQKAPGLRHFELSALITLVLGLVRHPPTYLGVGPVFSCLIHVRRLPEVRVTQRI